MLSKHTQLAGSEWTSTACCCGWLAVGVECGPYPTPLPPTMSPPSSLPRHVSTAQSHQIPNIIRRVPVAVRASPRVVQASVAGAPR